MRVTDGFKLAFEDGISDVYRRAKSKGTGYLSQLVFGGGVDKSQKVGIGVADATDVMVGNTLFADNTEIDLVDEGVRTLQQGLGRNRGDPREEGVWAGYGRPGLTVWDETDDRFYRYVAGEWRSFGV
jgi:hypothetical protein